MANEVDYTLKFLEELPSGGSRYLQYGFKVESQPIPQGELSTRSSSDQSSSFWSPLGEEKEDRANIRTCHAMSLISEIFSKAVLLAWFGFICVCACVG